MLTIILFSSLYLLLGIVDVLEVQPPWPKDANRIGMAIGTLIVVVIWLPLKLYGSILGRRRVAEEIRRNGAQFG